MPMPAITGSISTDTHDPETLIARFEEALYVLDRKRHDAARRELAAANASDEPFSTWQYADFLHTEIEACLPEGWRFGAREEDGADFGIWPVVEAEAEATVLKLSDTMVSIQLDDHKAGDPPICPICAETWPGCVCEDMLR
jgi:hypothetical protein